MSNNVGKPCLRLTWQGRSQMKFSAADLAFEVRVQAKSSHHHAACGYGMWKAKGSPRSISEQQLRVHIK